MKDLLRIASLLDSSGNYKLSDKLFKIAQYSDLVLRQPGVNNSSNQMFLEPGAEYLRPAPDITWADGLNKLDSLYSNNGYNFAKNLYEFGRKNKITNLADAFDMYADAGALYDNQSIKINPIIKELYNKVINHNGNITEQQLGSELDKMMQSNNTYQGMPGLMKEPMNPSSYVDYATYLRETGQNRKAPMGTNNDDQIRDKDYLRNQQQYLNELYDDIKLYANSNDLNQLEGVKNSVKDDLNLTPQSKNKLYGIIDYYKNLMAK
jgi:hypothetical protein